MNVCIWKQNLKRLIIICCWCCLVLLLLQHKNSFHLTCAVSVLFHINTHTYLHTHTRTPIVYANYYQKFFVAPVPRHFFVYINFLFFCVYDEAYIHPGPPCLAAYPFHTNTKHMSCSHYIPWTKKKMWKHTLIHSKCILFCIFIYPHTFCVCSVWPNKI